MIRKLVVLLALVVAMPLLAETRQRYTVVTNTDAPRENVVRRLTTDSAEKVARRVRSFRNVPGFAADLTAEEAAQLRASAGVTSVDPVVERYASAILPGEISPNYDRYDQQVVPWGVPVIRADQVWSVTRGESINVAVLDTGIDWNHPDLQAAYAGGVNVLDPTKSPMDDNLHGTHVAGIIAATDNEFGVVGAAPGVKLWSVKALDQEGKGLDEYTAAGIDWVIEQQRLYGGRWVINMSIGAAARGGQLERIAVDRAYEAGIVLVAAAGNRNQPWLDYPAQYPGVIAVGAIGEDGRKAEFSSWGGDMQIVAPGVLVQSTMIEGVEYVAEVLADAPHQAAGLIGSPYGTVTGKLISCGLGHPDEIPPAVSGNIALIHRGDLTFREKARNAKEAGAIAVVIWNHLPEVKLPLWTLWPKGCGPTENNCDPEWKDYPFPLTIGTTEAEGLALAAKVNQTVTVTYFTSRYMRLSGTSMSTPYAASVAALLLALQPTLQPVDILFALRHTARDTGDPGWDRHTAYGIVDARAAGEYVAPEKFGVPPPNYKPPRRRSIRP